MTEADVNDGRTSCVHSVKGKDQVASVLHLYKAENGQTNSCHNTIVHQINRIYRSAQKLTRDLKETE